MADPTPFKLFIYGTLTNPWVFRAVLGKGLTADRRQADGGETFWARRAILSGYKKISPDNTYQYAVKAPQGRIRGYIVGPLPGECLSLLRKYEGRNYQRRTLLVHTGTGDERAAVFIGNADAMQHSFGHEFRDHFKQEVILQEKIDAALAAAEAEQLQTTELAARQAMAELHGSTIRDLQRRHFESGGISDYAIRHSLADEPLPNYRRLADDPAAHAVADNYLRLVVRQVMLNQVEERTFHDCRYELDHMSLGQAFYERTFSLLSALRLINGLRLAVDACVDRCLSGRSFQTHELVDFVRQGVLAADDLYDADMARAELDFIAHHIEGGYVPLGAEMEFSNIGHGVIVDPEGRTHRDTQYDGFLYFNDFALDALTWKLGGHVDDHHEKVSASPRRGFFEAAIGNLSVHANISKPVTNDPWTLNQLIHQVRQFYDIAPHSVHISMQLRSHQRPLRNRALPAAVMKCLFAIAGEPLRLPDGRVVVRRLHDREIRRWEPSPTMMFSHIARRHSQETEDAYVAAHADGRTGRYVQQFKFLRLSRELNYEPIAVALKGLQVHFRPGNFLVADQYARDAKLRSLYEEIVAWGTAPEPLSPEEIEVFLAGVYAGLMTERRGKPHHSDAYIHWSLDQLREMIRSFNALCGS
ncbi:MAG: gamma-glutamylcyclotransferase family protein [Planctomycetota bacterium]|jgi:hypothetical protein